MKIITSTGSTSTSIVKPQYNDDDYYENHRPLHRSKNYNVPPGIHIMNQNEKKALRKLKKETGLSEEEIRKVQKYRIILSEAQKEKGVKNELDNKIVNVVKRITKQTKLPVQHPEFKTVLKDYIEKYPIKRQYSFGVISVDDVILQYLRLRKNVKNKSKKKIINQTSVSLTYS